LKNQNAVALGRLGGQKTSKRLLKRKDYFKKLAEKRWKKYREDKESAN